MQISPQIAAQSFLASMIGVALQMAASRSHWASPILPLLKTIGSQTEARFTAMLSARAPIFIHLLTRAYDAGAPVSVWMRASLSKTKRIWRTRHDSNV